MKTIYQMQTTTDLLRNKKEHLECLLELTQNQMSYIDQEDLEDLLHNIAEKQEHIDALEALQADLNGRKRVSVEDAQLAIEINKLVEQISAIDRGNQQMVRDRMNFVQGQVSKVSQGRRSHNAYHAPRGPVSTFDLNR